MSATLQRKIILQICAVLLLNACFSINSFAADPQLKIGSLVPKNSLYHRQLMEVGEAWKKSQTSASKFNVFTDGSQGGEAEMVRRMRIGQLQAALLSVVGLREIEPSIAALQNLPLAFRSWEELDYVREKMRPHLLTHIVKLFPRAKSERQILKCSDRWFNFAQTHH